MKTVVRVLALFACLVTGSALSAADAYVQSSGTQSVALDYFLKSTSRVEADFELVDLPKSSGAAIFGAWGSTTPLPFGVWVLGSSGMFETRSSNGTSSSVKAAVGIRYRVVADLAEKKCYIYTGEALSGTIDFSPNIAITGDSVYPLVAFARCNSSECSAQPVRIASRR